MTRFSFFLTFLEAFAIALGTTPLFAQTNGTGCHLSSASGSAPKWPVDVHVKTSSLVRTGDPITVEWNIGPGFDQSCRTPVYLLLSTTRRTRFEGDGFLALPPWAEAPFGIKQALSETRVFIPLHLAAPRLSGSLIVRPYQDGTFPFEWSIVEIPKIVDQPKTRQDFASGREQVSRLQSWTESVEVIGGNPVVVIRDRFTPSAPKHTIRSNSGEFDLQIFEGFYRILDVRSGELLQERAGSDPNFSPSGRFVGAFAMGPGYEVVDLYAGRVIATQLVLNQQRGYLSSVHLAAWSKGDAVLALSMWGYGGIEVQQTLVDGGHKSFPNTSCHACKGINTAMVLDFDLGLIALQNGWQSLTQRSSGSWGALSLDQIALFDVAPLRQTLDELKAKAEAPGAAWQLGGVMKLTHHCKINIEQDVCFEAATPTWVAEEQSLKAMRIAHDGRGSPAISNELRLAESRLSTIRGMMRHASPTQTKAMRGEGERTSTLWDRLTQVGLVIDAAHVLTPAVEDVDGLRNPSLAREKLQQVFASTPSAARRFPARESGVGDSDPRYTGIEEEASLIDPAWIRQLATWQARGRHYWLIQTYYQMGASSRNWLFLLHGDPYGPDKLVDFTSRLKFRVGTQPDGLDENGRLQLTDERGTTMGFGGWPSNVDKITVASNRYLIMSGLWTKASLRWLLLFDLHEDKILLFNRDLPSATSISDFGVTADGRNLVQRSAWGELSIFDVASTTQVLRGHDVDDELILFDARGYYLSSPEGAQFGFLKFPGRPGYNTLQQFEKSLHRPDIVRNILAGHLDAPDPALTPPPSLSVAVERLVPVSSTRPVAVVRLSTTSSIELDHIKVFVDGRLALKKAVNGRKAQLEVNLPVSATSRWVAVVAVDKSGYESVPQGAALTRVESGSDARLYAVMVGTDRYDDDTNISQLSFAKADAQNFTEAVRKIQGGYYGKIDTSTFLDTSSLRTKLPAKLRQLARSAREQDTIMLFAAGHGARGTDGKFYLVTRDTQISALASTALVWDDVASALKGAKARVFVLLDACHSGASGDDGSNDDAVSALLGRDTALTVIAAAKGRQESQERANLGGGVFTTTLVKAITSDRQSTDLNGNGTIELAELYSILKQRVLMITKGEQTPWIARNQMVGEIPLF